MQERNRDRIGLPRLADRACNQPGTCDSAVRSDLRLPRFTLFLDAERQTYPHASPAAHHLVSRRARYLPRSIIRRVSDWDGFVTFANLFLSIFNTTCIRPPTIHVYSVREYSVIIRVTSLSQFEGKVFVLNEINR